ncbi:thymidine phosphorylase [Ovoidimarina sediminis]|uniref:thymidine phosphorylase n=1 Tax=Ovoidimarina sediminis TaxID=3079856 RepID=UPI00290935D9|nr:thymidine phosphorylase [Rhodophyticola sp. MJ-SS7]MDU8943320.1 thymidine phosphorylase [Rhodophyticola sp. MJ-SS7]
MDARRIIRSLREGEALPAEDLAWFARGLADGTVTDAQAGAFAMAVCLKGLGQEGRVALTTAMRDSGHRLGWDLPGPVVDKHSTGGLGDCVSLLLAPMLAASGVCNPMISGRGLGHTGGTLDKLEAIPGLSTEVPEDRFRALVADIGCAIVAASADMAPADRRLYAIRDVTSTVESIDLITASILSKKLAAGLDCLILDVKVGTGAFMETMAEAEALAESLVDTANGAGCRTAALITDMDQPLAPALGNALEVAVVMEVFTGAATHARLTDLTIRLGSELLALAGFGTLPECESQMRATLSDGRAAEIFGRMVAALGGPADFLETWGQALPSAPVICDVPAPEAGAVSRIDGRALGEAVVHLGGGRLRGGDRIDPAVGLSGTAALGQRLEAGAPLATIHAADAEAAHAAAATVLAAYEIGDAAAPPALVRRRIA